MSIDPDTDLLLERTADVPPELVWAGWTRAEHLPKWFCPRPWRVTECQIDLRAGGAFRTVMRGPEGPAMDNTGCFLEVVAPRRLVWTGALRGDFRPNVIGPHVPFVFTAVITIEPRGNGTLYRALACHADRAGAEKHAAMGFHAGWGAAFDQLVEAIRAGQITSR